MNGSAWTYTRPSDILLNNRRTHAQSSMLVWHIQIYHSAMPVAHMNTHKHIPMQIWGKVCKYTVWQNHSNTFNSAMPVGQGDLMSAKWLACSRPTELQCSCWRCGFKFSPRHVSIPFWAGNTEVVSLKTPGCCRGIV